MRRDSIRHRKWSGKAQQAGAALYIALIMLVLLALLGIVGMQVATMQERMSANFMASNIAFQNAERLIRNQEASIVGNTASYAFQDCNTSFDPTAWANGITGTTVSDVLTTNISICTGQCSAQTGSDKQLCSMYRTTVFSRDRTTTADSTAAAAVDTIYIKP
jgi:type IV pilus assembly protein PilX